MDKLSYLFDDLRSKKVLPSCSVMYKGDTSCLLRYQSDNTVYSFFALINRSSVQCYRVFVLLDNHTLRTTYVASFRNSRLAADYINSFLRRN